MLYSYRNIRWDLMLVSYMRLREVILILFMAILSSSLVNAAELIIPHTNFSLSVPDSFTELSEADIESKWGAHNPNRPKWAVGNEYMGTTISYSINPFNISAEPLPEVLAVMQENMSRVVPGIKWVSYDVRNIGNKDWAYLEFTSFAIDQDIHNIMLIRPSGDVMVILNFNSVTRDFDSYEEEIRASIDSIKLQ